MQHPPSPSHMSSKLSRQVPALLYHWSSETERSCLRCVAVLVYRT